MERQQITADLVRELVREHFPQWAHLSVTPVDRSGWDNITMRLGHEYVVRLPSGPDYAAQVHKEQTWLPRLAPHLSLSIPQPVALAQPCDTFPRPWSVYKWLQGEPPTLPHNEYDYAVLADQVGTFLNQLQHIDPAQGPTAGWHCFNRRSCPSAWHESAHESFASISDFVDPQSLNAVWTLACGSTWTGQPVSFHGDMSPANMLFNDNQLTSAIDFGTCGVGDPACDLVIAWTLFDRQHRHRFRESVNADEAMWARARGWMIWKAATTLRSAKTRGDARPQDSGTQYGWRQGALEVIHNVLAET